MTQNFLQSSASRTLSLMDVARLSEADAKQAFQLARWPQHDGRPACPRCDCVGVYELRVREEWKCKNCDHRFSVTSGTLFASRKLSLRDYLFAVAIFANGTKGVSGLHLARDIRVTHKTAFVLGHKLREAMAAEQQHLILSGTVEVDGAFFGGHMKYLPVTQTGKPGRLLRRRWFNRRAVVVARQREGRTLAFVVSKESEAIPLIRKHVAPGTVVHADSAHSWDALNAVYDTLRINHSVAYSYDGACTNMAESYFARLRRVTLGVHHHVSGNHLRLYAAEAAWREDYRKLSNGEIWRELLALAMRNPARGIWTGYWQRRSSNEVIVPTPEEAWAVALRGRRFGHLTLLDPPKKKAA